jgi:hypothetical protein
LESLKNVKAISVGDVRRVEPSLEEGSRGLLNVLMHLWNKDFEKSSLYDHIKQLRKKRFITALTVLLNMILAKKWRD